jgi:hypothetical protein
MTIDSLVSMTGSLTTTQPGNEDKVYLLGMSCHIIGTEWIAILSSKSTIDMTAFNIDGLFNSANYTLILEYTKV